MRVQVDRPPQHAFPLGERRRPFGRHRGMLADIWFVVAAGLLFVVPELVGFARYAWTTEQGAQGPIILASGLWLLVADGRALDPDPGDPRIAAALLVPALLVAIAARLLGMMWLDWLGSYAALVIVAYAFVGRAVLVRLWFPLAYLLFIVPPPYAVSAAMTTQLKLWISAAAIDIVGWMGFDVARSGAMLYVDQYELLMADACAGLNSLFSLLAVGLFYVHVRHRASWDHALVLAVLALPIAILANLVRVIVMLVSTVLLGDEVTQSWVHEGSGLLMFVVALFGLIAVDALLVAARRLVRRP